jgi:hypothetical protein
MPDTPPDASPRLPRLDATARVLVALLGTMPLTVLLVALFCRGVLGGTPRSEILALLLLIPVWIAACSVCLVFSSGLRVTAWVAGLTALAALLLRLTT